MCGCRLSEVNDEGAVVTLPGGEVQTIQADTVIMSVGFRPLPSMREQLKGIGAEIYEVGDGNKVGSIMTSIWQAYEVAHAI